MRDQQDAYERLIRPIEDQMIRSVWRIVRNADDVDDAFQDALARIWKRWDRIQRHENPQALILRICINAAFDSLRRKVRERKMDSLRAVGELLLLPSAGSFESVSAEERKASLTEAINRLPKKEGMAIHLRFIEEQSYEEIGRVLACRPVSARKRVSRAIRRLRGILPEQTDRIWNPKGGEIT